jgi:hypothetical protein
VIWPLDSIEAEAEEMGRSGHDPRWVVLASTARATDRGIRLPKKYLRRLLLRAAQRGALLEGVPL